MMKTRRRLLLLGSLLAVAATALSGCSASGGSASNASSGSQGGSSCQAPIAHPKAPEVSLWAWYPDFKQIVSDYNKAHQNVQVCWTNVGAGNDEYTKFTTASQAGSGAPDVVMLETEVVPSYIATGAIIDLSKLGADKLKSQYSAGAWKGEEGPNGDAYAIPKDGGPVGLLYRKDIFEKYGITSAPTTWAEYAQDAKTIYKGSGGKVQMTDFPANGRDLQVALFAQAGAKEFAIKGKTSINIKLNDAASTKVLKYWAGLVHAGYVDTINSATTTYDTKLVNGSYASNVSAAWLPGYMKSYSGAQKGAQWAAAPLPQWNSADPVQVNIGGSAFAVTSQAKNRKLAAQVAMQLLGNQSAWNIGIDQASLFPLWLPALNQASFADKKDPFFGGQQVNKEVFVPAAKAYQGVVFSPFQNFAYDQMQTAFAAVNKGTTSAQAALNQVQSKVVTYAKQQGYTVTTNG